MDKFFVSIVKLIGGFSKHNSKALLIVMPVLCLVILIGFLTFTDGGNAQKYKPTNSIFSTMIMDGKNAITDPSTDTQNTGNSGSSSSQNSSDNSSQGQSQSGNNSDSKSSNSGSDNSSTSNSSNNSNTNSDTGSTNQPQQPAKPVAGPPSNITGPANLTVSVGSTSITYTASTNDGTTVLWQPQNTPGQPEPVFLIVPSADGTTPTSTATFQVEATSQAVVGQTYWVYLWINSNTMYPMTVTVTN